METFEVELKKKFRFSDLSNIPKKFERELYFKTLIYKLIEYV